MKNEILIRVLIIVSVFFLALIIFKSLQNNYVFKNTLGKIAITYKNISDSNPDFTGESIVKTKNAFVSFDESHFIHWDVKFFKYMSENSYGKDDSWPGTGTYAFSPLFPFIWGVTHLPARYIAILNYLLFACSILILSSLFLDSKDFTSSERLILFIVAMTLPSVFSFYLPYCESTFIFTMSIAMLGLFKKRYWLFFTGIVAFTLSRPSFMIFLPALVCTDIYFFILNRNPKMFLKEMGIKLLPVIIGIVITFYVQKANSGSFFKMFQVQNQFWAHSFRLPSTISDWSTEGYGMNIFSVLCVAFPAFLIIFISLLKNFKSARLHPVSLFSQEKAREYLFVLSAIYFAGNFLFVALTQGGNLNGLHRYILASPFCYIFFFILMKRIKDIKLKYIIIVLVPMVLTGYLLLIHGPYQHKITFLDSGYFLLVFTMTYLIFFNSMTMRVKLLLLLPIVFCNTLWLCYLYNHFLNNAYIIA